MKIFTFSYLITFFWGLLLPLAPAAAQNYQLPTNGTVSYTTCSGTLYDDGGPVGNCSSYSDGVVTLTPATAGSKIQLAFSLLEVNNPRAVVQVFDGPSTSSLLIGAYSSGTPTVHATNTKGELTVRFYSNGAQPLRGFAATISCETNVLLPDLTARNASVAPARVMPTQRFTTTMQLANLSGPPALSYAAFYFSRDSTLSQNDLYIASSVGERLEAGQSITYGPSFEVPAGTAPGRYYVLCIADPYQAVSESNERNNQTYATVEVLPPAPDLVLEYFGGPTPPSIGSVVPGYGRILSCSVRNQGVLPAGPTAVGFYLSPDNVLDASDSFVDQGPVGTLAAGQSAYATAGLSIPVGTPLGRYYVFFVVDYLQQVAENDETNNTASVSLDVVAPTVDLAILYTPIVYPNQAGAGSRLNSICYVENRGNTTATPCTVGYYLSKDKLLSADDVLMGDTLAAGSSMLGVLESGDYSHANGHATIPLGTPTGQYYVLVVADHLHQLAETDETNNVSAVPLEVVVPNIDLVIGQPAVNPPAEAGNPLSVNCYLINQGTTTASPGTVGFYLSTDPTLSADDKLIGKARVEVLPGQGGNYAGAAALLPLSTVPGPYYVLLVADYLHQVAETKEDNNVAAVPIVVVKPTYDLTFKYQPTVGPSPTPAGSTLLATCHLQNLGPTSAYGSAVGYYLSTDNVLSANDVLIGSVQSYMVSGNYFDYLTGRPVLPLTTAPGTYYVLFVADYLHQLAETNEDNNVASATVQVTAAYPDLTIVAAPIVSPTQAVAGTRLLPLCTLSNQGNGLAEPATVGYYLSTDQILSANDVLIGQASVSSVYPGSLEYIPGTASLPAGTAPGRYYVLFVADYLNQLAESNETNNTNFASLLVTVTGVDLSIQLPTATPTAVVAGGTVAATCSIFNGGNAPAASSPAGFYLSTDPAFDAADVLLGASAGGALVSSGLSPRAATLTIPATTATGNYYLLLVADPLNAVLEANENNNVAYLSLTVTGTFSGTVVPASGNATLTACAGKVYDNGGPTGNYPNAADGTLTIVPGTVGGLVYLTFSSFATENGPDYLQVYDGLSPAAPLLGTYSGSSGSGLVPGTVKASASNASGALTLRFVSNGSTNAAGFEANIGCSQRLATREQTAGYTLSVSPNPVAGLTPLHVQLSGQGPRSEATLTLLNSLGQQVAIQAITLLPGRLNQADIDTRGLAAGVYLLRLTGPDLNATRRLVVE